MNSIVLLWPFQCSFFNSSSCTLLPWVLQPLRIKEKMANKSKHVTSKRIECIWRIYGVFIFQMFILKKMENWTKSHWKGCSGFSWLLANNLKAKTYILARNVFIIMKILTWCIWRENVYREDAKYIGGCKTQ